MKKKTLILMLSVAAITAVAIGATIAYFSDVAGPAQNVFTVGNVDITLTEPSWNADNATDVYPGEVLAKDPVVSNTGANPCMVRIKVVKPISDISLVGLDSTNWTLNGDYYYYNTPLNPDTDTTKLFTGIQLPTSLTNADSGSYTVSVTAQAVQSEGIPDTTDIDDVIAMFDAAF